MGRLDDPIRFGKIEKSKDASRLFLTQILGVLPHAYGSYYDRFVTPKCSYQA